MDTRQAFALSQAAGNVEHNVFDWLKAASLIVERKPVLVEAGLASDMEWTSGPIWADGAIVPNGETYTYLSSNWATPVIVIDGEEIECFKKAGELPGWDSSTYWPPEALKILVDAGMHAA